MRGDLYIKDVEKEFRKKLYIKRMKGKQLVKARYFAKVKRGDWRYIVPEFENWDDFEKYRDEQIKIKENKMKREIEIRLSKNYQVGAVNVREIEEGEWDTAKEFALSQAREILSQLPSDSESKQVTKKQYKKVEKQEQNQSGNGDFPPLTKDYMGYGGKKQWDWYASEVEKVKDHPQFNPYELEKLQGDYENGFKLLSKALNYIKTH